MNEIDFLRGIETPAQSTDDLLAGSEHLVRLKQQAGQSSQTQYPDLELEKTAGRTPINAARVGRAAKGFVSGAADTAASTAGHAVNVVTSEGGRGYSLGRLAPGAALGAGAYALGKHNGKKSQSEAEKTAGDFTESLNTKPSKMCSTCHKEKDACMCDGGMKTAAFEAAKSAIKSGLKSNPALRAAAIGGIAAGIPNAAMGAAQSPPGDRIGGAVRHGLAGAAIGAGSGALVHHLSAKLAFDQTWHRAMLGATTGAGALAGGIGTYLASRPQADTGKGKAEEELEGAVAANKTKPERGLLEKLKNRETETAHGFAKAFREHPKKAALIGLLTGALAGHGIGQLGGAIARRGGK